MDQQKNNKNACVACSCPCEIHKEHNHPVEDAHGHEKNEESKNCSTCGTKHKDDGAPACGCN